MARMTAPSAECVSWKEPTRRHTNSPARQMPSWSANDPSMNVVLFDLRMLVHRQRRARRPFEGAGHLALRLVLIDDLDRDAWERRRFPFHLLGPNAPPGDVRG